MILQRNDIHLWLSPHKGLRTEDFLRKILTHYLPISAYQIHFSKTKNGKPYLKDRRFRRLEFNVSHSHDMLVCAISYAQQLGVDIEYKHRKNRLDEIAERYFHPQETQQLQALTEEEDRRDLFFRLWTSKEAYIKALGLTIGTVSLDKIAFSYENNLIQALFETPKQQQWHFKTLAWNDYLMTVAVTYRHWHTIKPELSVFSLD